MLYLRLTISYDGSAFSGWQRQKNALSVQEVIENHLETLVQSPVTLTGASRTDAGVHAKMQVAHCHLLRSPLPLDQLQISLNRLLPSSIRIIDLQNTSPSFHAQYSAKQKVYHYKVNFSPIHSPFEQKDRLHYPYPISLSEIKRALPYFIGEKNFQSFSNDCRRGAALTSPIKTLTKVDLLDEGKFRYTFIFEGNGFLYKMVRNIVGTLLDIGRGKIPPKSIPDIFAAKDRRTAGKTAPSHGLTLMNIIYNELS